MKPAERLLARAQQQLASGQVDEAAATAMRLVERFPRLVPAWAMLGAIAQRAGRYGDAEAHLRRAAELEPGDAALHNNLSVLYREWKRPADAEESAERAVRLRPGYAVALNNLGLARMEQEKDAEAIEALQQAIEADPRYAKAHHNLGNALVRAGRTDDGLGHLREALRLEPLYAQALNSLGAALQGLGRSDEAVPLLRRALQIRPGYTKALVNLGQVLVDLDDAEEALACFRQAAARDPSYVRALTAEASLLERLDRRDEAAEAYQAVLARAPRSAEALFGVSRMHDAAGRFAEARAFSLRCLEAEPGHEAARASLLNQRAELADWTDRAAETARVMDAMRKALDAGRPPAVTPSLSGRILPTTPDEQLRLARDAARRLDERLAPLRARHPFTHARGPRERLRIGYLSADLRNHAVGHLVGGLFRTHDRAAVEVFAYSYGPDDGSPWRRRFEKEADRFLDVRTWSHPQVARRINEDGVDVLVDLMGWTGNGRMEILALRPAPLQVHFLGYPGTTGAAFVDYFVADRVTVPADREASFSEALVMMPHAYQINDREQEMAASPPPRSACGLPEDGFVFCSFNRAFKIDPEVFDVWMRILGRVPGSVLWLYDSTRGVAESLRKEAQARGLAPERLVFAPLAPKPQHLARHAHAGLFLDTPLCNAHTTASDALFAGLPVLTCPGTTFSARVAASLVTAAGQPEMVVPDLQAYEDEAVALAGDPSALGALRQRLVEGRTSSPLFDTPAFVRGLERAYRAMWRRFEAGEPPARIDVDALTG